MIGIKYWQIDCFTFYLRVVGKGKSHTRNVTWEVPFREVTCPGPSALQGMATSSFPRHPLFTGRVQ